MCLLPPGTYSKNLRGGSYVKKANRFTSHSSHKHCGECGILLPRHTTTFLCPDCLGQKEDTRYRDYFGANSREDYDDDPDAFSPSWAADN
jgi:predicted RNA-binding Zn-ribbon protein involved in translation (DUF1610 family)